MKETLQLRETQLRRESDIVKKMYRDILQETTKRLGDKPHVDIRVKSLIQSV